MKKISITSIIIFTLCAFLVYGIVTGEYLSPSEGYYAIRGGGVMPNITFEINTTPNGASGVIDNATLYHNISGTWGANYTNTTNGTVGTETNRIFPPRDTLMNLNTLTDGLIFSWNVYACDNISMFYNEPVMLSGGKGGVSNYPVSAINGIMNDSGTSVGTSVCNLTSTTGRLSCNQSTTNTSGVTKYLLTPNILVNYTISSTCRFIGSNRTIYVEDSPSITINSPTTSTYSDSEDVDVNITVYGDSVDYQCEIYSNDTGNWSVEGSTPRMLNNTSSKFQKQFTEGNIVFNSKCWETKNSNIYGWSTSNITLTIDETDPVIVLNHPSDSGYKTTKTFYFNATVNDSNLVACRLYLNSTILNTSQWNSTNYNESVTSMTSGTVFNFSQKTFSSDFQNLKWAVWCNDSAGNYKWSSNYTVSIDTTLPGLNRNLNYSTAGYPNAFTVEFNFSKEVNATFKYGLTSMSQSHILKETDYAINQTFLLTFNDSYETNFYANITCCDVEGNCNNTLPEMVIKSPISLKENWTIWSIYDSVINLSDLYSESKADYVYYWNNTGQEWIYHSSVTSSDGDYNLGVGDSAWFYSTDGISYFRNNTGSSAYHVNVTGGNAFFPLYHDYTFGNISYNIFRNDTGGNVTSGLIWTGGLEFIVEDYASYNNSAQEWELFYYTWSSNNATMLGKNTKNGLDTLWAYVDYNLSINFTPNGEVIGNWT